MPVLDVQRRGQQIGRLRIGQQVSTGKKNRDGSDKMRPARLDTFRFTTSSRYTADAIAALYGGEVREWVGQWEVITGKSEIGVTVPPRDEVVSQWYEMWNKGGAVRRCNSQVEQITGKPCLCPHAEDTGNPEEVANCALKRAEMAKLNPPQACKLVTRISVMIPDLPGLGVFRLDSGSYYAAVEIGDSAALMQMARDKGVFLPAILRIEQRARIAGGKTTPYPVPVLEVLTTFRDIVSGAIESGGLAAQMPPVPGQPPRAITAGAPAPAPAPAPVPPASPPPAPPQAPRTAQQIADDAAQATTRGDIERLASEAKELRAGDDLVCTDTDSELYEELHAYLQVQWKALPAGDGK